MSAFSCILRFEMIYFETYLNFVLIKISMSTANKLYAVRSRIEAIISININLLGLQPAWFKSN